MAFLYMKIRTPGIFRTDSCLARRSSLNLDLLAGLRPEPLHGRAMGNLHVFQTIQKGIVPGTGWGQIFTGISLFISNSKVY
jgi:hypothetical protein